MTFLPSDHAFLAKQHDIMARNVTARDAHSGNRRTAHEHAADAHRKAADGGSADFAFAASRRAGINPHTFAQF